MSNAIAGMKGKLYIDAATDAPIAELRDLTLTIEGAEIDVTSFDSSGWVTNIPGLRSWSVEAEGLWLANDTNGQDAIFTALTGGTTLDIIVYPEDAAGKTGYKGKVVVTSFEVGIPLDDAVTVSLSFTGSGALTEVTKI